MIRKIIILLILFLIISINIVNAQIINGNFETGDLTGWTSDGFYIQSTYCVHFGTYNVRCNNNFNSISQTTDFTGFGRLNFYYLQCSSGYPDNDRFYVFIDEDLVATITDRTGTADKNKDINVSEYSGNHTLKFKNDNIGGYDIHLYLDNIILTDYTTPPLYITLNFKDNCGNLLPNIEYATAREGYADYPLSWHTTGSGSADIVYDDYDYLEVRTRSALGELYYNISNPSQDINYTILNPTISWNNNIMVVDGNTSGLDPISGALVSFFQDCIIDSSVYPSRNKFTDSNGFTNFEQCELDSFSLGVSADGYKSYSGSISSSTMDAFISSQTVMIKLYPVGDEENESEYIYTNYNTWVKFKNVDGNYISTILDTDEYVDLYYYNNNSNGESMILKFQKYSIETGIIDLLSWNIPIDTDGYKRILKSNYTDTSYLYIGHLYNYSIDGWDRTEYLNIRNETSEIDLDYQNLTAFVLFRNKNSEGSIDYREDIEIIAYANTSYVGLFNISLELYDNGSFITHINLTWADFIAANLKYYYEWNPSYSYINGHNYTVRMHGYDYYLLDMDYVNATDYRKNKLTIIVKDRSGANLNNSFVFLEGYGLLSTHDFYYNSYEDLVNGNYRYKASKSGYSGTGWDEITLADGDEIVAYILISDTANTTYLPQKTSDEDVQAIFFPLIFALLIFILIGAFKYVCE